MESFLIFLFQSLIIYRSSKYKKMTETRASEASPSDQDVEAAVKQKAIADAAYQSRNFKKAIKVYDDAMKLNPTNAALPSNLSAAQYEAGAYQACLSTIQTAFKFFSAAAQHLPPATAERMALRAARAALWLGKYDDALAWLAHEALEATAVQLPQIEPLIRSTALRLSRQQDRLQSFTMYSIPPI
jgi:tetratricopeptide (TPR) repeat protein